MRLQLTGLVLTVASTWAAEGRAQPYVAIDGRGGIYQDTDETTVITAAADATVTPVDHFSVSGGYLADIVSSASVDVVAAATGRWEETRHQGKVGVGYDDEDRAISGGYIYSVENDYRSHTGTLAFSHDVASHLVTLGASASFTYDMVGRSGDANFDRRLLVGGGDLDASIVLSKDDLLMVTYSLHVADGYQASPYRFVRFDSGLSGATSATPESLPDLRLRNAAAARWNHHFLSDSALRSSLRAYLDNWGIYSVTAQVETVFGFADDFELAPFVRGYLQSSAGFYRETYDEQLRFMTSDRELSAFVDGFAGLRFGFSHAFHGVVQSVRADAKVTGFAFRFFEFPALTDRQGIMGDVGLGVTF